MLGSEHVLAEAARPGVLTGALHFPARARRVVQMFMAGAASHIDLFDYKPALIKHQGEPADLASMSRRSRTAWARGWRRRGHFALTEKAANS